jgi:hypothetical protein
LTVDPLTRLVDKLETLSGENPRLLRLVERFVDRLLLPADNGKAGA